MDHPSAMDQPVANNEPVANNQPVELDCDLLFVYGTLKSGCDNHHRMDGAASLGAASVAGVDLHDLGPFPMAIDGSGVIHGELYRVGAELLAELDRFEGAPRLYRRVCRPLADGRWAWIYLGRPRQVRHSPRLPAGIWPAASVISMSQCARQPRRRRPGAPALARVARSRQGRRRTPQALLPWRMPRRLRPRLALPPSPPQPMPLRPARNPDSCGRRASLLLRAAASILHGEHRVQAPLQVLALVPPGLGILRGSSVPELVRWRNWLAAALPLVAACGALPAGADAGLALCRRWQQSSGLERIRLGNAIGAAAYLTKVQRLAESSSDAPQLLYSPADLQRSCAGWR